MLGIRSGEHRLGFSKVGRAAVVCATNDATGLRLVFDYSKAELHRIANSVRNKRRHLGEFAEPLDFRHPATDIPSGR